MAEEYDLSDVLNKPSEVSNAAKEKTNFKIKVGIGIGIGAAVVGILATGFSGWFALNDFEKPLALNENVTRWTSFSWVYGDDVRKLENDFGVWTRSSPETPFTNEALGCVIRLTAGPGPETKLKTDVEASHEYTQNVIDSGQDVETKTAWVEVDGAPKGTVEVVKTAYTTDDGSPAVAYYRVTVDAEYAFLGIVNCESEETLNEVAPFSADGKELEKLNLSLKP